MFAGALYSFLESTPITKTANGCTIDALIFSMKGAGGRYGAFTCMTAQQVNPGKGAGLYHFTEPSDQIASWAVGTGTIAEQVFDAYPQETTSVLITRLESEGGDLDPVDCRSTMGAFFDDLKTKINGPFEIFLALSKPAYNWNAGINYNMLGLAAQDAVTESNQVASLLGFTPYMVYPASVMMMRPAIMLKKNDAGDSHIVCYYYSLFPSNGTRSNPSSRRRATHPTHHRKIKR